jgi:hypothetical protein
MGKLCSFLLTPNGSARVPDLADHGGDLRACLQKPTEPEVARTLLKFFDWAYRDGTALAESLDYVAVPAPVTLLVERCPCSNFHKPEKGW